MTEREAMRILGDTTLCSPLGQAAFRAIECIKELRQYRTIGTAEECLAAMEKLPIAEETIRKLLWLIVSILHT